MGKAVGHSVTPLFVTVGLQARTGVRARCGSAGHSAALPTEIPGAVASKDCIAHPDGDHLKTESQDPVRSVAMTRKRLQLHCKFDS